MLKKPMTTEEYFNKICGILKEKVKEKVKGMMPDIRWHDLRSTYCTPLLKQDFNPKAVSRFGLVQYQATSRRP